MFKRNKKRKHSLFNHRLNEQAQSAIEYMLLFAAVMVVVMYSFDSFFPFIRESANLYYNGVIFGVTGEAPPDFCNPTYGGTLGCGGY